MMRLHELIQTFPLAPPAENPEVTGIAVDSRQVQAGDLFVALPGLRTDGRRFSQQAAQRGAVAVLGAGQRPDDLTVPWVASPDPRHLVGPMAARLYEHPDERLLLVGVTGTNGKSTVATAIRSVLEAAGKPTGLLGTLGYSFREQTFAGQRTTPEAADFFRILHTMAARGAQAVAMEVSSHALALGRVAGAHFDLAVFTNLTHDHLDFHHDLENYFAAKRQLFTQLKQRGHAVLNLSDPYGRRLADEFPAAMTFGPGGHVFPRTAELDLAGLRVTLATPRGELSFASPLLGRFHLENLVAAAAAAEAIGLPQDAIARGLSAPLALPGRLERVDCGQPFPVLVDYAHTPAALEAALLALRELSPRQILVVFGCGGDRDQAKRPVMGRLAGQLAEHTILTSDNPRGEDPLAILSAIESGIRKVVGASYQIAADRHAALAWAIAAAIREPERWAVLVAGKGHEAVQQFADREIPFSDRAVLTELLQQHGFAAGASRPEEARYG